MLRYMTDRARPGFVTLYDIWPGNGAGQFLQLQSPHGARRRILLSISQCNRYNEIIQHMKLQQIARRKPSITLATLNNKRTKL